MQLSGNFIQSYSFICSKTGTFRQLTLPGRSAVRFSCLALRLLPEWKPDFHDGKPVEKRLLEEKRMQP